MNSTIFHFEFELKSLKWMKKKETYFDNLTDKSFFVFIWAKKKKCFRTYKDVRFVVTYMLLIRKKINVRQLFFYLFFLRNIVRRIYLYFIYSLRTFGSFVCSCSFIHKILECDESIWCISQFQMTASFRALILMVPFDFFSTSKTHTQHRDTLLLFLTAKHFYSRRQAKSLPSLSLSRTFWCGLFNCRLCLQSWI